jgi:hypothetical protein
MTPQQVNIEEIAVGTPMFCREQGLTELLASLPASVANVYVADNGDVDDHTEVYERVWPFDLRVLDVEYDAGIGACRAAIADAVTEPYLFMCDNDMALTRRDDLRVLREILRRHDDLGGVAGWLREGDVLRSGARNLTRAGGTIIKDARGDVAIQEFPYPHARFEFIPQCVLFRTEIFETYSYDPQAGSSEHVDFFLGHKRAGEWAFASTPSVVVNHNRWIDEDYRTSTRGGDHVEMRYVEHKWGVENIVPGTRADWAEIDGRSVGQQAFDVFRRATPPRLWLPVRNGLKRVGLK